MTRSVPRLTAGYTYCVFHANAASGVHRIEDAHTNWYLIEEDGGG